MRCTWARIDSDKNEFENPYTSASSESWLSSEYESLRSGNKSGGQASGVGCQFVFDIGAVFDVVGTGDSHGDSKFGVAGLIGLWGCRFRGMRRGV